MKSLLIGIAMTLAVGTAYAQPKPATTAPTPVAPATTVPTVGSKPTPPATGPTTITTPGNGAAATGNSNQAVATTRADAPVPAKGKTSFTIGQARSRIQAKGFTNVVDLVKDKDGVWRGHADRDGTNAAVWVDYKGNVGIQ